MFSFFKQKTAYEMRISDWSSDVCSSDLRGNGQFQASAVDGVGHLRPAFAARACREHHHIAVRHQMSKFAYTEFEQIAIYRGGAQRLEVFFLSKIGRASCRARGCQYV